jgi:regulator of RNase E activity RraA
MTDPTAPLDSVIRNQLMAVSTSTLATVLFKRGFRNQFVQGVKRLGSTPRKMVGPAFTLRYMPAREDLDVVAAFQDPNHPQRKACELIPPGHVLVMDCRGDASAASAGSILLTRLMVRGCAGVVSDGGLRDADVIAELDLPSFAAGPSAPTNLTRHHAIDINLPIGCGTAPGWRLGERRRDLIRADHSDGSAVSRN